MVRVRVQVAAAAASVLAVVTGGCSKDEPVPKLPDSPSPSVNESPAASGSPTVDPAEETPEEFVRRWVALADRMQETGRTAPYRRVTRGCEPCSEFADAVREVYESGGRATFAGSTVVSVQVVGRKPPTVRIVKDVPETVILRAGGAREVLPAGRSRLEVVLRKQGDVWTVSHYVVL